MGFCASKPILAAPSYGFTDTMASLREASAVSATSGRNKAAPVSLPSSSASKTYPDVSSKPLWLFVFDFDLTIAKYHMWGTHNNAPLADVPITNDTFVDLRAFQDFVTVIRDLGHHITIASFGRKDIINKAMTFALGEEHGVVISTPGDHGLRDGSSLGSKNRQLKALADRFSVVKNGQIILFDDDGNNVKEALKIGVGAIHTPGGLTKAVLAKAAHNLWKRQYKT